MTKRNTLLIVGGVVLSLIVIAAVVGIIYWQTRKSSSPPPPPPPPKSSPPLPPPKSSPPLPPPSPPQPGKTYADFAYLVHNPTNPRLLLPHIERVVWRTYGPRSGKTTPDKIAQTLNNSAPANIKLSIAPDTELGSKGQECIEWTNQETCSDALVKGVLECPGNSCTPCTSDSSSEPCCENVTTQATALKNALKKVNGPVLDEVVMETEGTASSTLMVAAMKDLLKGNCSNGVKISCVPGVINIESKPYNKGNPHPKTIDVLMSNTNNNKGRAYLQCYSYDYDGVNTALQANIKDSKITGSVLSKSYKQGGLKVIPVFKTGSSWLSENKTKSASFIADCVFNPISSEFEHGVGFLRCLLDHRAKSDRDHNPDLKPWPDWTYESFWDVFYLMFSYEYGDDTQYLGIDKKTFNGEWFAKFRGRLRDNIVEWATTMKFFNGTEGSDIKIGMYGSGDDLVTAMTSS